MLVVFIFVLSKVICTQPRKIAAISLSKRVAFEFAAGKETNTTQKWVGHHVSGDKRIDSHNRIQYMTETVLLNQLTQSYVFNIKSKNFLLQLISSWF
jgi:HrpA-like RNA helicase